MEIRELTEGDVRILVPDGSVTAGEETSAIEARLDATLKAGVTRVLVDCAAVKQLTSGAVRVLLMTSRRLDRLGGRLVPVRPSRQAPEGLFDLRIRQGLHRRSDTRRGPAARARTGPSARREKVQGLIRERSRSGSRIDGGGA